MNKSTPFIGLAWIALSLSAPTGCSSEKAPVRNGSIPSDLRDGGADMGGATGGAVAGSGGGVPGTGGTTAGRNGGATGNGGNGTAATAAGGTSATGSGGRVGSGGSKGTGGATGGRGGGLRDSGTPPSDGPLGLDVKADYGSRDATADVVDPSSAISIIVNPASPSVTLGVTQQFAATIEGGPSGGVDWQVQEGTPCGGVDGTGLYTPPASVPAGACHIVATLLSDATVSGSTLIYLVKAGNPGQACAAEPLRSTGQIHYVCDCQSGADSKCVPGSDNNAGTSPAAPLQTFSKAADAFSKMNAGDTVALCRGGKWTGRGGSLANTKCKKDSTCDLRDYAPPWGNGSEALPSLWSSGTGNGVTMISFTHESAHYEGYRVLNLDMHGSSADTALFFWNETTDVDLC
ncbi:MAG TPA: hypothetical protein VIM14_20425, partial [Polyangia bacterium]